MSTEPAANEPGQFSCYNLKDLPVMSWINSIHSVGFQYVRPPHITATAPIAIYRGFMPLLDAT